MHPAGLGGPMIPHVLHCQIGELRAFLRSLSKFLQLEGTENSAYVGLLCLFAHGIWSDYKSKLVCIHFC